VGIGGVDKTWIFLHIFLSKDVLIGSGLFVCPFVLFEKSPLGPSACGHGLTKESQDLLGFSQPTRCKLQGCA
jgi:hypothetical protein